MTKCKKILADKFCFNAQITSLDNNWERTYSGGSLIYEPSLGEGNEDKGSLEADYTYLAKMNEWLSLIRSSYSTVIYSTRYSAGYQRSYSARAHAAWLIISKGF